MEKTIEDQAVQLRFNVDLIRKFKQAQEATMEKLIDADAEIAELQHRIQKLEKKTQLINIIPILQSGLRY